MAGATGVWSGAASGVTGPSGAAVCPPFELASIPRNWSVAVSISSGVAVTNRGPGSLEVDLLDRRIAGVEEELQHLEHRLRIVDVRGRVLGEDLDQLLAVPEQPLGRDLRAGLAQELLLAGGADDVVVCVAIAGVVERVEAAERLVAGLQVDLLVVGGGGGSVVVVEVAPVDVDVDAVEGVDRPREALEVDVHEVVDLETGQGLHRLEGELGAAVGVGRVELVGADAGDLHLEIARQREEGDRVAVRVEPQEHRRIREPFEPLLDVLQLRVLVGAEDEDRLGAAAGHLVRNLSTPARAPLGSLRAEAMSPR